MGWIAGYLALALMLTAPPALALPTDCAMLAKQAGARLTPVAFSAMPSWAADDHAAAFSAFRRSCVALFDKTPPLRPGLPSPGLLKEVCEAALAMPPQPDKAVARTFFETHFIACALDHDQGGFLTGYFEPEIPGSHHPGPRFSVPVLARPDDLVTLKPGESVEGLPEGLSSYRRDAQGAPVPYPERAAIEAGALGDLARPLLYTDPVDLFMAQVQGSVRVHLAEGGSLRLAYAGRNGQPYTSLGKLLAARLGIPPAQMTADRLYGWLRAHPHEGRALMRQNKSYVFFRVADELDPALGPLGAASVQLTPGRSIAVDRHIWPYGLPFFLQTELPQPGGGTQAFAHLVIAQDTGAAIMGAARADLYVGSGEAAGLAAGLIREPARFVVLLPRPLAGER